MALRMLQVVLPKGKGAELAAALEGMESNRFWSMEIESGLSLYTVVLRAERVEKIADRLSEAFSVYSDFRLVVLPAEATRPKLAEPKPEPKPPPEAASRPAWKPLIGRIAREELIEDLSSGGRTSPLFIAMVVLSTVVACVGMMKDSAAVVIGAMVIAPLLGPNMALALGTTLGDTELIKRSLRSNAVGVAIALGMAVTIGLLVPIDAAGGELVARASVDVGDVALALSSGAAGALAATAGTAGTLVGVMVAVALLPPTCACGLFLGSGAWREAGLAAHLLAVNVVCINASAKAVFLVQRVRPDTWWEANRAKNATRRALLTWIVLLLLVVALLFVELF